MSTHGHDSTRNDPSQDQRPGKPHLPDAGKNPDFPGGSDSSGSGGSSGGGDPPPPTQPE
jgi:hypothetical protein